MRVGVGITVFSGRPHHQHGGPHAAHETGVPRRERGDGVGALQHHHGQTRALDIGTEEGGEGVPQELEPLGLLLVLIEGEIAGDHEMFGLQRSDFFTAVHLALEVHAAAP